MKKHVKTILRTALLVLAALIVGLNIYHLNASTLAGDLVPMPLGVGATVVLSGSMEPTLSAGDLLLIKAEEEYAVGDVVVFQTGGIAVVHRIIEIRETTVEGENGEEIEYLAVTQGDANNTPDDPIRMELIKGTVALRIPLIGHIVNLIKTPVGTIVILGAAILLLERSFRKEKEKDNDKLDEIRKEIEKLKQSASEQQK